MSIQPKNYEDIINTKYPLALKHPRMSMSYRAAQFSAFKALSGYDAEIDEAARLTDVQVDLDESAIEILDAKLQLIKQKINNSDQPLVRIVYFIPDIIKDGEKYVSALEEINKVDESSKSIQTITGVNIPIRIFTNLKENFLINWSMNYREISNRNCNSCGEIITIRKTGSL